MNTSRCIALFALVALLPIAACEKTEPNSPNVGTTPGKSDDSLDQKTPDDQSQASKDIDITAAIRRAIMNDKTMSMSAQNCKIITENTGVVTLRGEVASEAEKNSIDAKARAVVGVSRVDNQLLVKAN